MKYARPSFSPAANSVQPLKADRYCSSDVANRPEVFPASATMPPGRTPRTISGIRSACQYIQQTIRSQAAGSIRNSWRSRSARTQRTPGIGATAMSTAVTLQPRLASQVECRPEPQARSSANPAGTPVRQRVSRVSGWLFVASIFSLASLPAAQITTTIHDVSIIDVATAQITPHQDIVIRGERIAAIRPAAQRSRITRYVIPGLWDMHVHLSFPRSQFPLFLANGVTGVRDMGTDLRHIRTWQSEIAKGEVAGPRIYACGSSVSSTPSGD
ncbi:MAG TPA: hypothetical protein VHB50_17360, partial [Bryobacteraceae bacterium]|nr:hypothetical protein [Bryobacteraceae bacterium]